ncbi:MAG: HepT-like ribonuclease domain-containing protein [Candidatus Brocadiales bacterium]
MNSCIDISKLILTAEGKRLPETYKEIVQHATLVLGFTEEEVNSLSQLVILRNIVAHEYLDIRWASIKRFLEEAEPLYRNFSGKVREYLKKRL